MSISMNSFPTLSNQFLLFISYAAEEYNNYNHMCEK